MPNDDKEIDRLYQLPLADFKEFETAVTAELKTAPKVKLLLDLTHMAGFTLDVAWEDLKFTRAHAHDFRKIAIVTSQQWVPWLGWVSAAFTDAASSFRSKGFCKNIKSSLSARLRRKASSA